MSRAAAVFAFAQSKLSLSLPRATNDGSCDALDPGD
jgi:hypothetical protein